VRFKFNSHRCHDDQPSRVTVGSSFISLLFCCKYQEFCCFSCFKMVVSKWISSYFCCIPSLSLSQALSNTGNSSLAWHLHQKLSPTIDKVNGKSTTLSTSIIGSSLVSMDTSSTQLHDVPARHLLFRQVFLTSSYKFRTYIFRLRALDPPLPSRYTSSPITEHLQES
jgi:hypothetical protein